MTKTVSVERIITTAGIPLCTVWTEPPSPLVRVAFRPERAEPDYVIAIGTPAARDLARALQEAADDAESDVAPDRDSDDWVTPGDLPP